MSRKNLIFLLLGIVAVHLVVIYGCMVSSRQENPGNPEIFEGIFERLFESVPKEMTETEPEKTVPQAKSWIYGENPQLPASLQSRALKAKSVFLVDLHSRQVIYERNSKTAVPIASLTKLMSLLVISDKIKSDDPLDLEQTVVLSNVARSVENAKLRAGRYKMKDLLYSMIVGSYNDAATQLAISASGNVPAFVGEMNKKAAAMGLKNAKFNSPSGLPQKGENSFASTAEVALLCEAVTRDPELRKICSTARYTLSTGSKRRGGNSIGSDNQMINARKVDGAFGFKTGFTNAAGRCVAFGIERNGRVIIGVVTGYGHSGRDRDAMFDFSIDLAEWAFKNTKAAK